MFNGNGSYPEAVQGKPQHKAWMTGRKLQQYELLCDFPRNPTQSYTSRSQKKKRHNCHRQNKEYVFLSNCKTLQLICVFLFLEISPREPSRNSTGTLEQTTGIKTA